MVPPQQVNERVTLGPVRVTYCSAKEEGETVSKVKRHSWKYLSIHLIPNQGIVKST